MIIPKILRLIAVELFEESFSFLGVILRYCKCFLCSSGILSSCTLVALCYWDSTHLRKSMHLGNLCTQSLVNYSSIDRKLEHKIGCRTIDLNTIHRACVLLAYFCPQSHRRQL